MKHLLVINGSYRYGGVIDQALAVAARAAEQRGALVEIVHLRDYPIEFCRNCRACTRVPGEAPGTCVQADDMAALVARIEAADAYILASPTNFYSATALFKRFMERLLVYAYWPWGMPAPRMRKAKLTKRAILITSSAAPALLGRLFFGTLKQLRATARTLGAKPVGDLWLGLMARQEHLELDAGAQARIRKLVAKLP